MVDKVGQLHGIPRSTSSPAPQRPQQGAGSFSKILAGKLEESRNLNFSAHAAQRISERNIKLGESDLATLANAADKAQAKGAKESLFLLRDLGFIVNIKNRTVVTALDTAELKERVFTNIDSTLILE
jgi:flagellar operon protein